MTKTWICQNSRGKPEKSALLGSLDAGKVSKKACFREEMKDAESQPTIPLLYYFNQFNLFPTLLSSVCTIGWWLCPAKTIVIAIRGKKSSTFSRSHFFLIWLCANLVTPLCRNWIQYELVLLIYILNRLKNYIILLCYI